MADDLVRFILEGLPERHGNIPADVFLSKFRLFVATLYGLDRAFAKKTKRSIDLDIVDLRRVNPAIVAFRPRSDVPGYDAVAAVEWGMAQLERIHNAQPADAAVPLAALDNIVELSRIRDKRRKQLTAIRAEYRGHVIEFDGKMATNALAQRVALSVDTENLWRSGVSKGSLFGELMGVMDTEGERQFYIVPPSGPGRVQCIFPEEMRAQMNANLFKVVRVHGYLSYDGTTAFPYLVHAERLEGVAPAEPAEHFSKLRGAFADYEMPDPVEFG